jgi:hypothetical protein
MIDYALKFPDVAAATAALFDGETARYLATDIIGVIVNEEGPTEGWHVNVRHTEEAPELEQWRVYPETPVRVWA